MRYTIPFSLMKYWKQPVIHLPVIWSGCAKCVNLFKSLEQLIDNIPEGDFQAKTKAVLKLPKGEFYQRVETARGEFGVYISE